jgi:hypothetical protein
MQNYGWIELVFFYGIALGFGLWQWLKMRREVKEIRARRAAEEAAKKAEAADEG